MSSVSGTRAGLATPAHIPDSVEACPECGVTKATWTVHWEKTRQFTLQLVALSGGVPCQRFLREPPDTREHGLGQADSPNLPSDRLLLSEHRCP